MADVIPRRMTIWQRLYVRDKLLQHQNEPHQTLGLIAEHGLVAVNGRRLDTKEVKLPSGHKVRILTEKALEWLFETYPIEEQPDFWREVAERVGEENKLPFGKVTKSGGPEPNSSQQ